MELKGGEKMKLLVTGGAGFIGSNFIHYLLDKYPDYHIFNYDKLTYAGNLENLASIQEFKNYSFIKGDINNQELLEYVVNTYEVDVIVNFAAESHVDRSIRNSSEFVTTNILGTQTLLDVARIILSVLFKFLLMKFMAPLDQPVILLKRLQYPLTVPIRPVKLVQI